MQMSLVGISVADKDNTSIFSFIFFKVSLCLTPNLCSSISLKILKSSSGFKTFNVNSLETLSKKVSLPSTI